jgi:GTP-binding protein
MKVVAAELFRVAASPRDFPAAGAPEIAFLGRSNVGKSSLLNRLVGRRQLARTSATPGKTRLVHFYRVVLRDEPAPGAGRAAASPDRTFLLVDLPGYGYARVAKDERAAWQALVESYLDGRRSLRAAALLHDVRRDPGEDERLLLDWLDGRGVPALFVLTKCDKLPPMQRAKRVREIGKAIAIAPERVIATSAEAPFGIDELWSALLVHAARG